MCGRYAIISAPEAIRALFAYEDQPNFPPRYNVAPTQPVPIVRLVEGKRRFALVRWGLLPAWVKDPRTFTLAINARGESVNEKPAFRLAMRRRRCLFPADGFYEWRQEGKYRRPFFVRARSGGPLAFAGLWETWMGPNGEELDTATIVTTRANRTLATIHERMPAVIAPDAFDFWLDCHKVDADTAAALIAPAPEQALEAFEISPAVNHVANDSPDLIAPATPATSVSTAPANQAADKGKSDGTAKDSAQPSLFD
jgi:putative SOS response-associated peptidase YedK